MKSLSQEKIWNAIARKWYEFKTSPGKHTRDFLKGKTGKILDLGSGAGRNLIGLKTKAELYLLDFSKEMIELAKKRAKKEKIKAKFFVADATKLPFEDNFFNCSICISLLHCIPTETKRKKVVKELYRVLKPGSETEISVWNKASKRFKNAPREKFISWRDKGKRYYYLYEPEEIYKLFESAGFKIIKKQAPDRNIIFVVEKPAKNMG